MRQGERRDSTEREKYSEITSESESPIFIHSFLTRSYLTFDVLLLQQELLPIIIYLHVWCRTGNTDNNRLLIIFQ